MSSNELRERFLNFFAKRGHAIIPSASLVPENDPSVLFTTAGMQPLVPYLLGEPHPKGRRLANIQKCVRTGDLDDIGDNRHLSFFEMMGNWSLGDYFKKEAITWSYEFLTSKKEGLGLNPGFLYVTVFEGDENAPRDTESADIWTSLGIPENRIYFLGAEDNWWSAGDNGPCGPDTEMFYDVTGTVGDLNKEEFLEAVKKEGVIEVWNDVFMEYEKKDGKVIGKLSQKNVDTGAGLERITAVMQGKKTAYETDLFADIMGNLPPFVSERKKRIIADHVRTSVFMIADGVLPGNKERGYVLRRLLRRAIVIFRGFEPGGIFTVAKKIIEKFSPIYANLDKDKIFVVIKEEQDKFMKTLNHGLLEFEKGTDPFILFTTYGLPIDVISDLAKEKGAEINLVDFNKKMAEHQKLSQSASAGMFKGGLADANPKTVMLHTATHLMLAGLRKYLGEHVHQAGSNITEERTRFDFNHPEKVSPEILKNVEAYVNEAIAKGCTVTIEKMSKEDAQAQGVEGSFWEKYPDMVNVYMVKAPDGTVYSRELCGGPHVENTGTIAGRFRIIKEESVSAGVRRIKAVIE